LLGPILLSVVVSQGAFGGGLAGGVRGRGLKISPKPVLEKYKLSSSVLSSSDYDGVLWAAHGHEKCGRVVHA
jgi:hypothetical protein